MTSKLIILFLFFISCIHCQNEPDHNRNCVNAIVEDCLRYVTKWHGADLNHCIGSDLEYRCFSDQQCADEFGLPLCEKESCSCVAPCSSHSQCEQKYFCGRKGYCIDKVDFILELYYDEKQKK